LDDFGLQEKAASTTYFGLHRRVQTGKKIKVKLNRIGHQNVEAVSVRSQIRYSGTQILERMFGICMIEGINAK
jgi:hypothetical protein